MSTVCNGRQSADRWCTRGYGRGWPSTSSSAPSPAHSRHEDSCRTSAGPGRNNSYPGRGRSFWTPPTARRNPKFSWSPRQSPPRSASTRPPTRWVHGPLACATCKRTWCRPGNGSAKLAETAISYKWKRWEWHTEPIIVEKINLTLKHPCNFRYISPRRCSDHTSLIWSVIARSGFSGISYKE